VAAPEVIDAYLGSVPGLGVRRLAHGEWGLTIPAESAGGEALDVGLRLADGLLRVQAVVLRGDHGVDPWMLLWWNRQTRLVRFGCTRSRDVWVHADVAAPGLAERDVDRLLGLVAEAALAVRSHAWSAAPAAGGDPQAA
jgi:hypothetical protein